MSKPTPKIPIAALPAEADALTQFTHLRQVLSETHSTIPDLLAKEQSLSRKLGLAETEALRKELQDVTTEREAASRRRAAAIGSILALEAALQSERLAIEAERQRYAAGAVKAFEARYSAIVGALQQAWEEGRALGMALRCEVRMDLPVRVRESLDGISRAQPVRADVAGVVDEAAARLGAKLDEIDGALAMVAAIRQSQTFDQTHHRLGLLRGTAQPAGGVYKVLAPFRNLSDGLEFLPGMLIDQSLVGPGMMSRLMVGRRHIEPAGLSAAA
jgi:hypothetical protein